MTNIKATIASLQEYIEYHRITAPSVLKALEALTQRAVGDVSLPEPECKLLQSATNYDGTWSAIVSTKRYLSKDTLLYLSHELEDYGDRRAAAAVLAAPFKPVDMVLYCPKCATQHIDAPDEHTPGWLNPPHKSHLCHQCKHVWRPSDAPTNGVAATASGKDAGTDPKDAAAVLVPIAQNQIDPVGRSGMKDKRTVVLSAVEVERIRNCLDELTATYPILPGCAGITAHTESSDLSHELLVRLASAPATIHRGTS